MYKVALCPSASLHRHPWLLLGLKSELVISMKGQCREEKRMNGGRNDPYYRSPRTPMAYRSSTHGNVYVLLMQFREEQRISLCVTVSIWNMCLIVGEGCWKEAKKPWEEALVEKWTALMCACALLYDCLSLLPPAAVHHGVMFDLMIFWNGVMMMYLYQPE